ncbi:MAG TPA: hypothetical protein VMT38_11540 [Terracidiphilus sp.]|nr:hypothetical protein [Terracidiphilus sp.]
MYDACRHIKSSGDRCKSPALHGSHFCFFHDRLHSDALSAKFDTLRLPVAEDFSSILLALTRISAALIDSRIDTKRAAQLIWIQQLALQVVSRRAHRNDTSIRQFVRSGHGEEIASPLALCDPGHDCDTCAHKAVCARSPQCDESEYDEEQQDVAYEYRNEVTGEPARCAAEEDEVDDDDDDQVDEEKAGELNLGNSQLADVAIRAAASGSAPIPKIAPERELVAIEPTTKERKPNP